MESGRDDSREASVWELLLVKGVTDGAVGEVEGKTGGRRV